MAVEAREGEGGGHDGRSRISLVLRGRGALVRPYHARGRWVAGGRGGRMATTHIEEEGEGRRVDG
jgi:hypothetical protein